MEYEVTVNDQKPFSIVTEGGGVSGKVEQILMKDVPVSCSFGQSGPGLFSILYGSRSFQGVFLGLDRSSKSVRLKINGQLMVVRITEPVDRIIEKMGWERTDVQAVNQIVAPMPGLIVKVHVQQGQQIKKGDPLVVLEAMKMENVFKASADAVVNAVKVQQNDVVNKGMVLVELA